MRRPFRLVRKYGNTGPCYRSASPSTPLVFIDLGKHKVGWAVFCTGELSYCGTATVDRRSGVPEGCWPVVETTVRQVIQAVGCTSPRALHWVCEWPHVRPNFRKAMDDIAVLQEVGKDMGSRVGGWKEKYRPAEWKGTVPKPAHRRRVWDLLSPSERQLLPAETEHDTWDAVAGGLFALGRCGTGGLLSG